MLVRLSPLDTLANPMALCGGFVFLLPEEAAGRGEEEMAKVEEQLKAAAERVKGRWAIDVPDNLDEAGKIRPRFVYTSEKHKLPYHEAAGSSSTLPPLACAASGFLPSPKLSLFRPPSCPTDLFAHKKKQLPLLHLHLSFFTDAVAVGVNVPHGAFDGTVMGFLVRGLDAELHGRDWDVPPLLSKEVNPLEERLEALLRDETVKPTSGSPPVLKGYTDSASPLTLVRIISNALWEAKCHRSRERRVFLRQDLVEALVKKVKAEVARETGGKEYVSSAVALLAWLLRAFHADESSSSSSIAFDPVYSMRPLLSAYNPRGLSPHPFDKYPHNAVVPYALNSGDTFPLATFSSLSVSSLALSLRRGLQADRVLPVLKESFRRVGAAKGSLIPVKDWPELPPFLRRFLPFDVPHTTRWDLSNQTKLGLCDLHLPDENGDNLPLLAYYLIVTAPIDLDHYLQWQDVPGVGVTVLANTRESRWKSFVRELEKLKEEVGGK